MSPPPAGPPYSSSAMQLREAIESLRERSVVLFGGKGGVGKTTMSVCAALLYARSRPTILFTTDPASNLDDLFGGETVANLRIENLDAPALYDRFLAKNLESILEAGDRGTYLDKEELRRFFELSIPGIDELMAWMRLGELAEEHPDAVIVVDTAPTGHTMRMLAASGQFERVGDILDAMQEKHRDIVRQLTRRDGIRDAIDEYIENFQSEAARRHALLTDSTKTSFVPVLLAEPWVVAQTRRLIDEVRGAGIDAPFAILNRAVSGCDCARCAAAAQREEDAELDVRFVKAPRACTAIDTIERLRAYVDGAPHDSGALPPPVATTSIPLCIAPQKILIFFAGKGGVGKTTSAASTALQLAAANPDRHFVVISVDPAHALRDVFANEPPPSNLSVEIVDTKAEWDRMREMLGQEIERAVSAITPRGLTLAHDEDVMKQLVDMAPPGADELFALTRIHDLLATGDTILVDTAPTGHFLRLLDLPRTAAEWVHEFMRILLRYRELIPAGTLGEQLLAASRALSAFQKTVESERTGVVVVTRPERIVIEETVRLLANLRSRGIAVGGVIANYVIPRNECRCDAAARNEQLQSLFSIAEPLTIVERRDAPVVALDDLRKLVPIVQTGPNDV